MIGTRGPAAQRPRLWNLSAAGRGLAIQRTANALYEPVGKHLIYRRIMNDQLPQTFYTCHESQKTLASVSSNL